MNKVELIEFCDELDNNSSIINSKNLLSKAQLYSFRVNLSIYIYKYYLKRDFRHIIKCMIEEDVRRRLDDNKYYGDVNNLNSYLFLLTLYKNLSDSLYIWRIKSYDWDFMMAVDAQLLVFCGIEKTLAYLNEVNTEEAVRASEWIKECQAAGDFDCISKYFSVKNAMFRKKEYCSSAEDNSDLN